MVSGAVSGHCVGRAQTAGSGNPSPLFQPKKLSQKGKCLGPTRPQGFFYLSRQVGTRPLARSRPEDIEKVTD